MPKILPLCIVFASVVFTSSFSQDAKAPQASTAGESVERKAPSPQEETIKGTIKEIAMDGTWMLLDDTKVLITKELLEDSYIEVGDKVEVIVEKTDSGLVVKSCNYIFEEEPNLDSEGEIPGAGNLKKE